MCDSQHELWIGLCDLSLDERLDFDVVLCDEIGRVLLLVNGVNGIRAFEHDATSFTREGDGEVQDRLEVIGGEVGGSHFGDGWEGKGEVLAVYVADRLGMGHHHHRRTCHIVVIDEYCWNPLTCATTTPDAALIRGRPAAF